MSGIQATSIPYFEVKNFDVDPRTGFMPLLQPLSRLPEPWDIWEVILDSAIRKGLKLGDSKDLTKEDTDRSEAWRKKVREMEVLSVVKLKSCEISSRRAHLVLAWIMHFYINTLPPSAPILIPRPISLPLLDISEFLVLPPILTYSDDVLYNWKYKDSAKTGTPMFPSPSNITIQTTFTSTISEEHFYLVPAFMELRGAAALSVMSLVMDEVYAHDTIAISRIAIYLQHFAHVIDELTTILMTMRDKCDPEVFYHGVRPWIKGQDSMNGERRWTFEGVGEPGYEHLSHPSDNQLHGPSASQSSLIHAIDIFLGIDNHTTTAPENGVNQKGKEDKGESFLGMMQRYMPRHHRAFLQHLATSPRPLRAFVDDETSGGRNPELRATYNAAIGALRNLRDHHLRIVAMYIIGPSRRVAAGERIIDGADSKDVSVDDDGSGEKGTGGTDAMVFLKGVRDRTTKAVLSHNSRFSA